MNKKIILFCFFSFLFSCTKEFNTIGTEILKDDSFETKVQDIEVYASQKIIGAFNTTNLPIYQIGEIRDNIFEVLHLHLLLNFNYHDTILHSGLHPKREKIQETH